MTAGGKRHGAGRRPVPTDEHYVPVPARIDPALLLRARIAAVEARMGIAEWVRAAIREKLIRVVK